MRQIKFRAYHKKEKKMFAVEVLDIKRKIVWFNTRFEKDAWAYLKDVELREYTGLEDKKGKEIYEGDIVHYSWHDAEYQEGEDWKGEVEFKLGSFWLQDSLNNYDTKNLEVIGNIYENMEELLK